MFLTESRSVERAMQGCNPQVLSSAEGREAERKPRSAAKSAAPWYSRFQPSQPFAPSLPNPRQDAGTDGGESPSSSKSHNSDSDESCSQSELPFQLSGSQKKTAYALRYNVERLGRENPLGTLGFLTLTVGDRKDGKPFQQVWDAEEASRRFNNLARRVLGEVFSQCVVVTERHKNKAIHFHLVGVVAGGFDIRAGFDFEAFRRAKEARKKGGIDAAAESRYKRAASPCLRRLWALILRKMPSYGFGRAELTPIEKCGEAVASYVAKYVEKNLFARLDEDKGKRLVRYIGWNGTQLKPNAFSWFTPAAVQWRLQARFLARGVGVEEYEDMGKCYGAKWAFRISRLMPILMEDADFGLVGLRAARAMHDLNDKLGRREELAEVSSLSWLDLQVHELRQFEFDGMPLPVEPEGDWQWN